jgi:UDP-N-acetylmuramoyl-tripeptide--D-alanyl-D-alanine ligase
MLELGETGPELHNHIGTLAAERVDWLFTYGALAEEISKGAIESGFPKERVVSATSHDELAASLLEILQGGDRVLVKGSRGMRMEKVIDALSIARQKKAVNGNGRG